MQKLGINVIGVAEDGHSAINMFKNLHQQNKKISLITMDINMPNLDGKEAVKQIRQYEEGAGMK